MKYTYPKKAINTYLTSLDMEFTIKEVPYRQPLAEAWIIGNLRMIYAGVVPINSNPINR